MSFRKQRPRLNLAAIGDYLLVSTLIVGGFLVVFFLVALAVPTESDVRDIVSSQGYQSVETQGWAPFSCSEDDVFRIRFRALGPSGEKVRGVYCSAPLKGATVRILGVDR
jgi:hypothetical protein